MHVVVEHKTKRVPIHQIIAKKVPSGEKLKEKENIKFILRV